MLLRLSSRQDLQPVIERVVQRMAAQGFEDKDVFAMRLALEEAVVNALVHGNQGDPRKHVEVCMEIKWKEVVIQVQDQGEGFDPEDLPDPLAPENLERPCGRGVFLMRHYMTTVQYNEQGNCVTLLKRGE
jgi:serine/threonine-protein kinase RsbW